MIDLGTYKHDELHPDGEGLEPDSWDPKVDHDEGDPLANDPDAAEIVKQVRESGHTPMTATGAHPNPSGLSDEHRVKARDLAVSAALLGYKNRDAIHYSQNATLRWSGISHDLKAYRGQYPKNADCSSYATWCLWNGLDHYDVRDVVNGLAWKAGYTGTMLNHGVHATDWLMRGDCAIYGTHWPGMHTTICIGGGMCISHGSERGPLLLPLHYRADLMEIRRFI